MPILCQKNIHNLKTLCFNAHILLEKHKFSKKRCALINIFFQIFHEEPTRLSYAYLVKKKSIMTKLHYI